MNYKPLIKVLGDPQFYSNGLVFATEKEASDWGHNRLRRWLMAEKYTTAITHEPANYRWDEETKEAIAI